MDELVRTNPREFQRISARVMSIVNPSHDKILDTRELTKRIQEQAERSRYDRRIINFLKGGPQHLFWLAQEGAIWAQRLLGWIPPPERLGVRVRTPLEKWEILGLRNLIKRDEEKISRIWQEIFHARHELWTMNARLKPLETAQLRRLEREYLMRMGWALEVSLRNEHFW